MDGIKREESFSILNRWLDISDKTNLIFLLLEIFATIDDFCLCVIIDLIKLLNICKSNVSLVGADDNILSTTSKIFVNTASKPNLLISFSLKALYKPIFSCSGATDTVVVVATAVVVVVAVGILELSLRKKDGIVPESSSIIFFLLISLNGSNYIYYIYNAFAAKLV